MNGWKVVEYGTGKYGVVKYVNGVADTQLTDRWTEKPKEMTLDEAKKSRDHYEAAEVRDAKRNLITRIVE